MFKALFAGSFDPPTLGHLNLIERSARLFEGLIVALPEGKKGSLPLEERLSLLKKLTKPLEKVEIRSFSGLLVSFAKKEGISCLVRGVRSTTDLEYEWQMARANKELSGVETLLLPAEEQAAHISGSLIREIAQAGGELQKFIPPSILEEVEALLYSTR